MYLHGTFVFYRGPDKVVILTFAFNLSSSLNIIHTLLSGEIDMLHNLELNRHQRVRVSALILASDCRS